MDSKEDQEVERRLALTPEPFRCWSHWVTVSSFRRGQVIPFTTPTVTMPSRVPRSWSLHERFSGRFDSENVATTLEEVEMIGSGLRLLVSLPS